MTTVLSDTRLETLSSLIADRLGLHLPAAKLRQMEGPLVEAARTAGFTRPGELVDALRRDERAEATLDALVQQLTVGETYLYREPGAFAAITEHFLPEFARRRFSSPRPPRCWSAGCCTGEEAYTLAIALERAGFPAPAHSEVLATDLNPRFLRHAREGIYRGWSFRNSPDWLRPAYFQSLDDERAEIRGDLRRAVRFARLNLAGADFPSTENGTAEVDLILCRNVLMYFTPEVLARAVRRLADCLTEGGWLIVGAAETGHVELPGLVTRRFGDVTIFEKRAARIPAATAASETVWQPSAPLPPSAASVPRAVTVAEPPASRPEAPLVTPDDVRRLASTGDRAAALAACERLLRRESTNAVAHFLRASVLLENGAGREAEESLRRALYLEPDFVAAHLAFAQVALAAGRADAAERHRRTALRLVSAVKPADIVPETDGMTAGQVAAMINALGAGRSGSARLGSAALTHA